MAEIGYEAFQGFGKRGTSKLAEMEISKILNPSAGTSGGSQPPQKGKNGGGTSPPHQGGSSKEWEEKMRKKGMPTEGLNTFRVKKQ